MQTKCSLYTQCTLSTVCPDPVTIHQSSCHALPYCMPTDLLTVALNFSCLHVISILTQQCVLSHNWHVNCALYRSYLARSPLLVCIALASIAAACRCSAKIAGMVCSSICHTVHVFKCWQSVGRLCCRPWSRIISSTACFCRLPS